MVQALQKLNWSFFKWTSESEATPHWLLAQCLCHSQGSRLINPDKINFFKPCSRQKEQVDCRKLNGNAKIHVCYKRHWRHPCVFSGSVTELTVIYFKATKQHLIMAMTQLFQSKAVGHKYLNFLHGQYVFTRHQLLCFVALWLLYTGSTYQLVQTNTQQKTKKKVEGERINSTKA